MSELYIAIDESGTVRNNSDLKAHTNFFVIAGFITDKKGLQILNSLYLKEELKLKKVNPNYYNNNKEIKGINILPKDCAIILESIVNNVHSFVPFSIIVCKKHLWKRKWIENAAFNYFLKLLIQFLKENNLLTSKQINIYLDDRGIKTPFIKKLKEYLEQDLFLATAEEGYIFKVEYKNSKHYAYIRCADLIAYSILKIHENKSKRDRKFIKNLKKISINLNQNKTIFPQKTCEINNCFIIKISEGFIKNIDNNL